MAATQAWQCVCTMETLICNRHEEVARFVADRIGVVDLASFGQYRCIGVERDGTLVTGAVYVDFNGPNVWAHLATDVQLSRMFLFAGFDYPFRVMGCRRVSGWVEASNQEAIRLNKHLGYEIEARLQGAARDGGDVLIMRMFKENCRWLKLGERLYGLPRT